MKNLTSAWGDTLKYFQHNFSADYDLWIIHLNFENFDKKNKTLKLSVSNPFVRDTIISKFKTKIEDVFSSFIESEKIELELLISEDKNLFADDIEHKNQKTLPENKDYQNVEKIKSPKIYMIDINQKFTFDRFVVGANNKLAYSAAVSISQAPGKDYNPFFIYGGVGLGKTHLMQAIGNYLLKNRSDLKIIYVTVEQYVNDYVMALKNKKPLSFRAKYRETDVLLLDDVQFLEKKEGCQEEIFHTFNQLYQSNKQIVLTCDKPPKELKQIQERLITRLSWGLVLDIKHPDIETRKAIIIKKIEELDLSKYVDSKIIDYLSENITTNIRDIESAISKIKLLRFSTSDKISVEFLENNLSDILTSIRAQKRKLTCEAVQREVANLYHVSYSDMKSNKRTKDVSFPRQMAMFLSKELLKLSYAEIGNEFGGRDHSTVVASCKKAQSEVRENPSIRNDYEALLKIFSDY